MRLIFKTCFSAYLRVLAVTGHQALLVFIYRRMPPRTHSPDEKESNFQVCDPWNKGLVVSSGYDVFLDTWSFFVLWVAFTAKQVITIIDVIFHNPLW